MPITTKYTLMQQVQNLLNGGDPSAAARVQPAYIMKIIEQLINKKLKIDYFNTHLPSGETIPDGSAIATYDKVPVERYKGRYSRAMLPATPISLPRGMGIYFVGPFIKTEYLAENKLAANAYSSTVINLTWSAIDHAENYILERADDPGFTVNLTPLYAGKSLFFVDSGLTYSTVYYYRVKGISEEYNDSQWVIAMATTFQNITSQKLDKPTMKASVISSYSLELIWTEVPNAQAYFLERSTDQYFSTADVAYYGSNTYFTDINLNPGTTYYYRIVAIAGGYINSDVAYASQSTRRAGFFDNTFDNTFN